MHIKHHFVSAKADGGDATLVKPSDWNNDHDMTTDGDGVVIGRATGAGAGPVQELPISSFFSPGMVVVFAGATAPAGWLLCQGQVVNRTDYPNLFTAIGTSYNIGGESTAQFRIPDCRGRVIAMLDGGVGRLPGWNALGVAGGESAHALAFNEMPSHGHTLHDPGHAHVTPVQNFGLGGNGGGDVIQYSIPHGDPGIASSSVGTGIYMDAAGGNAAHNVIQPTIVMNMMIKT